MSAQPFDEIEWQTCLVSALERLSSIQKPFLENYWRTNGFPTQNTFNGQDETPFPADDLFDLYESARHAEQFGNTEYYKPLRAALNTVRGVLRSHPVLAHALGRLIGNDDIQFGVLNGSSLTGLSQIIVGQMKLRKARKKRSFEETAADLNAFLQLASATRPSPLSSDLDLGMDIALFHGLHIRDNVELGEGYVLMPYALLTEYVDKEWLEEFAPDHMRSRRWQTICAVVHPFRWQPSIRPKNSELMGPPRMPPPLFHRWTQEFANLLAVCTGKPLTWITSMEGAVQRSACDLLGVPHRAGTTHRGRPINHLYDPFQKDDITDTAVIEETLSLFAKRRDTAYPDLAPCIQRLAEALSRDGRYGEEDKVLDLAVVFERLFKPSPKRISGDLQDAIADLLGTDDNSKDLLRKTVKHFYDVRSAIIHGPSDEKKKRLRTEMGEASSEGFEIARQSLVKKLD
ncbi:hypothetical protein ABWH98_06180 [Labrenzia sp. ac12]